MKKQTKDRIEPQHYFKGTIFLDKINAVIFYLQVAGDDGAQQIAAHLKSQQVELEFLVDEGTVIVKDAVPGMKIPFAL